MAVESQREAFDRETQRVAVVYAEAFLGAAATAGKTKTLVDELTVLAERVLDKCPDFQRLLESAFVSRAQKTALLDRAFTGRAAPELLVFLKVLARHGRLNCLRAIARQTGRMYRIGLGRVDVELRAAQPVDAQLRHEIVGVLTEVLAAAPVVSERIDPELIGGLVVTVDDTVYDGSIKTQLTRLRESMLARCAEEIETHRQRFLASA